MSFMHKFLKGNHLACMWLQLFSFVGKKHTITDEAPLKIFTWNNPAPKLQYSWYLMILRVFSNLKDCNPNEKRNRSLRMNEKQGSTLNYL